jgi:hypothetical protein
MPMNVDVAKVLSLGGVGLCFLLVYLSFLLLRNEQARPPADRSPAKTLYAFMGFAGLLFVMSLVSQFVDQRKISLAEHSTQLRELEEKYANIIETCKNKERISGKIHEPQDGAICETHRIECTGKVGNFFKESGMHLWLAVEVNGHIWPKEAEIDVKPGGVWSATVYQDAANTPFSLDLLVADENAHRKILSWIDEGKARGGTFEKMDWFEGTLRLDRIDDLRLKTTKR